MRKEGTLSEIIDPLPYLIGMAKNIIKRYVEKGRVDYRPPESFEEYPDLDTNPEEEREGIKKCMESIKTLSKQLPKAQKEIFEDLYLNGKTPAEICKKRNYKSLKTFSSMRSQTIRGLLKLIEESDNHNELKYWPRRRQKKKNNDNKQQ